MRTLGSAGTTTCSWDSLRSGRQMEALSQSLKPEVINFAGTTAGFFGMDSSWAFTLCLWEGEHTTAQSQHGSSTQISNLVWSGQPWSCAWRVRRAQSLPLPAPVSAPVPHSSWGTWNLGATRWEWTRIWELGQIQEQCSSSTESISWTRVELLLKSLEHLYPLLLSFSATCWPLVLVIEHGLYSSSYLWESWHGIYKPLKGILIFHLRFVTGKGAVKFQFSRKCSNHPN